MALINPKKSLKFARNGEIFSSKTEVFNFISSATFPENVEIDGMPMAFRYSGESNNNTVHTALAIFYGEDNIPKNVSVFEDETLTNIIVNGVSGSTSDSLANVIISGQNIQIGEYATIEYPDKFITGEHVSGTQKINESFQTIEKTISALTQEVIDNEFVMAQSYNDIVKASGTLNGEKVEYVPLSSSPIISGATSLYDADKLLDAKIQTMTPNFDFGEY